MDAPSAFNSLPLADDVSPLKASPDMVSNDFTFILPHKRFDLKEGEALWAEKATKDLRPSS